MAREGATTATTYIRPYKQAAGLNTGQTMEERCCAAPRLFCTSGHFVPKVGWIVARECDILNYMLDMEELSYMNISIIDEYVYLVLVDNGWTEKRDFLLADSWIEKIEQKSGIQCFEYARKILHLFGGMKFREFSPKSGQYFFEKYGGDVNRLEKGYLRALERLNDLSEKKSIDTYNGATFTFDAWTAFLDFEIVIDLNTAERVVGERLFPIGTVEPDGITCAAESGNIYTLFDDSIFLSGDCIENYLNMLFIHGRNPKQLM